MPSRNTVKQFDTPAFYHVYNRGAGGQSIFKDASDKIKFLSLLERHLVESDDETYKIFDVEVTTYCLMGNHFHLLLYLPEEPDAITGLMRSVSTAYSMYFNRKYKTMGHVFQSIYRASHIENEAYLAHITRYIHLNPQIYRTYRWSSLRYFLGDDSPAWLHPTRVLDMPPEAYLEFLEDYEDRRELLTQIKSELAL